MKWSRDDQNRIVYTETQMRELFDLAASGAPVHQLLEERGISDAWVRREWHRRGWSMRAARQELMVALFERWCEGEKVETLAEESGFTVSGLRNNWSRNGLYMHTTVTAKVVRELWARRLAGEKTEDLAAEMGRSRSWLAYRWRQLGFSPHSVKHQKQLRELSSLYIRAWGMRCDEPPVPWAEIKRRLNYPHTARSLRVAVGRWRERNGIGV